MINLLLGYILGIISVAGMTKVYEEENKKRNGVKITWKERTNRD